MPRRGPIVVGKADEFAGVHFTEIGAPLPGVPVLDIDASRVTGHSHGDALTAITDHGSIGGAVTVIAAPTYHTNVLNGRPGLLFDGVDDQLSLPDHNSYSPFTQDITMYAVVSGCTLATAGVVMGKGTAALGWEWSLLARQDMVAGNLFNSGGSNHTSSGFNCNGGPGTSPAILCMRPDYLVRADIWYNGENRGQTTTFTSTMANGTSPLYIGRRGDSTQPFGGYIHQLLIFTQNHTDAQRRQVEHYLATKWGVTHGPVSVLESPAPLLVAEWVADDLTGTPDGNNITTWTSRDPLAMVLTQATATNQPTIQHNELNGHAVVRFDGTDNYMTAPDFDKLSPIFNPDLTVIAVYRPTGSSSADTLLSKGGQGSNTYEWELGLGLGVADDQHANSYQTGGANNMVVNKGAVHSAGTPAVVTFWHDYNVAIRTYYNGGAKAESTSVTSVSVNSTDLLFVGARGDGPIRYTAGDFAHILIYAGALTMAELDVVHAELGRIYGISTTPVS